MAYSTEEIEKTFKEIIDLISNKGLSLRKALSVDGMPSNETFYKWLDEDEIKAKHYARACEYRADMLFDEILDIADTTIEGVVLETDEQGRTKEKKGDMLGHRKLQVDARKWALSKMNPKKYSDKLQVDTSEFKEQPLFDDENE